MEREFSDLSSVIRVGGYGVDGKGEKYIRREEREKRRFITGKKAGLS